MAKIDDKQIVYINSRDRLTGNDGNFTYNINLKSGNDFDRVTCLQAGIPKSYYSVQSGINYFTLTEISTNTIIQLTPGNYTRNSLAVTLATLLTANSPNNWTYTVGIPNVNTTVDTGKYTYGVSGNGADQPSFTFDAITDVWELMGFLKSSTNPFLSNQLISTNVVNLQPFNSIQIHSNLVSNAWQTGNNTDILQSVFANVGSAAYSNISWVCMEPEAYSQILASGSTSTASFNLTDEDGISLDLNGVNMQMTLMFWKKNTSLKLLNGFIKYVTAILDNWMTGPD